MQRPLHTEEADVHDYSGTVAETSTNQHMSTELGHRAVVMSFNINGQDSWYPDEPTKQWKARAPLVRAIIDRHQPDIVCWQEFGVTSHADAIKHARHPQEFYMGEQAGDIYINPISWNPDRFRAVERSTIWLTPDGNYGKAWQGEERGCSIVQLEHIGSGRKCWVYNIHLDNRSPLARLEGVGLILGHIAEQRRGLPIIIAGDFNASSHSLPGKEEYFDPEPLRRLEIAGFTDSIKTADPARVVPHPTFHGYRGSGIHNEHDPYGVWDPDHIYVAGLGVVKATIVGLDTNEPHPSDHYPLEVEIALS